MPPTIKAFTNYPGENNSLSATPTVSPSSPPTLTHKIPLFFSISNNRASNKPHWLRYCHCAKLPLFFSNPCHCLTYVYTHLLISVLGSPSTRICASWEQALCCSVKHVLSEWMSNWLGEGFSAKSLFTIRAPNCMENPSSIFSQDIYKFGTFTTCLRPSEHIL